MNDNWSEAGNATFTESTSADVGAFALSMGSADAALAIALLPGAYTVHVTSADGSAGTALVEIYAVP